MEVYKGYSKLKLRLDDGTITLKLWKCFSDKNTELTTYSLSDDYTDSLYRKTTDPEYYKFISYLKIDITNKNWWNRCGQVISEEKILNEQCDYEYKYRFHYLTQTSDGDILHIIPFTPIDFEIIE